jgi:hypothetical protein
VVGTLDVSGDLLAVRTREQQPNASAGVDAIENAKVSHAACGGEW